MLKKYLLPLTIGTMAVLTIIAIKSQDIANKQPAQAQATNTESSQNTLAATSVVNGAFIQTFDGDPPSPLPWRQTPGLDGWEVAVQSRDIDTWKQLEPINAQHSGTCGAPPETHSVTSYDAAVFNCKNHIMTAINAGGYGVIYLAPPAMVDFSGGEAKVSFDVSTMRMSTRDWIDLVISPEGSAIQLPFSTGDVDLQGMPKNAVHINMDQFNGKSTFRAYVYRNGASQEVSGQWWVTIDDILSQNGLKPDAQRRDSFELTISKNHIKFGMPAYNFYWVDADINALAWDTGIVQLGHHSYNPTKDNSGVPGTWHWDNVAINPAKPIQWIRANERFVENANGTFNLESPAPANSRARFAAIGEKVQVSFNNGSTWTSITPVLPVGHPEHFSSYDISIPAGTEAVKFKGNNVWGLNGYFFVKDLYVYTTSNVAPPAPTVAPPTATQPPVLPTSILQPTNTPVPNGQPSNTPTPTPTSVPTATPSPTPAPVSNAEVGVTASSSRNSANTRLIVNVVVSPKISMASYIRINVYDQNNNLVNTKLFQDQDLVQGVDKTYQYNVNTTLQPANARIEALVYKKIFP